MFVFSDIEGSTVRWEANREAMQRALRRHDAILHDAVAQNHGYVFKTVGDEFCMAFQRARDALNASVFIQRKLAAEDFTEVNGILVRMAMHAGETDERSGDYYGPPVNRVARLLSTGYGGQVLLSDIVAEMLADDLPPDVQLLDLGWHRLKDLEEPEHVFQLVAPGLEAEFAALKSLNSAANNLPQQPTSFIGREDDIASVERLVRTTPLVSVVGTGGVGKTRLALQVAANLLHDLRDGVWFVNLAPIEDASLVVSTILSSLGVPQSSGDRTPEEVLIAHLKTRELLLLLDNCEHLIGDAARVVSAILTASPTVKIVATTREPLELPSEHVYRLPSLGIEEAMALFVDRARNAKATFQVTSGNMTVIEEICRRLDGIALAIELAAPRVRVLSLQELCERLHERFRVLTGGNRSALPRQQTLRALIDWSYDLLGADEQKLFRRLAVFSGSFTLEAAAGVCADQGADDLEALDLISALVDKSLVIADVGEGGSRYRLLQSIEAYACERMREADESQQLAAAHAEYFAGFAENAYEEWDSGPAADWLSRGSAELDNIRAALSWSLWERNAIDTGVRIIANAAPIFLRLSLLREAIEWAQRAQSATESIPAALEGRLEYGLSMLYNNQLALDDALLATQRALRAYQMAGDERGLTNAYAQLAQQYARREEFAEACRCGSEALRRARAIGDRRLLAITLQRCAIGFPREDIERSRRQFQEAVDLFGALRRDDETGRALVWWASAEAAAGCFDRAAEISNRAMPLVTGDAKLFLAMNVTEYALLRRDLDDAVENAKEALTIAQNVHHSAALATAVGFIAAALAPREPATAATLLAYARSHATAPWPPPHYEAGIFDTLEKTLQERLSDEERSACEKAGTQWNEERAFQEALAV